MRTRLPSGSGLEVSLIGQGCNNFGGMKKTLDTEGVRRVVDAASFPRSTR